MLKLKLLVVVCALTAASACTDSSTTDGAKSTDSTTTTSVSAAAGTSAIRVLSGPADMVSGGDALVEIDPGTASGKVTVALNGTDVTSTFVATDAKLRGLVTGLKQGKNTLVAKRDGTALGEQALTDYPITGPIFSGPHQKPYICTTDKLGLGPATDGDCSAPTKVSWFYYQGGTDHPAGSFSAPKPLDDPTTIPADVETIDRDGTQVPFIVREERGVIDRSVYVIHVLDPKPSPTEWDSGAWNQRLIYNYGGGCGTGYNQGDFLGPIVNAATLAAGYADVTSTLNVFQTACNDVLSAEVTMMVKEHFIETYGVPVHTIGEGPSGGSIQQHLIAQNYPGLLDAINPTLPFPDAVSISAGVTDCGLLANYWSTDVGSTFTDAQKLAVQGHGSLGFCNLWRSTFVDAVSPTKGCNALIPVADRYDATTNPKGARCTLQDSSANLFPKDAKTGNATRPLDNVGVQYGLEALQAGTITVDQFLDLNDKVGGYDIDGTIVAAREVAPKDAIEASYAKGRVLEGDGNILRIPVIHANPYTDLGQDIHDRFRAFTIRDRMSTDGKRPTNEVLYTRPGTGITQLLDGGTLPILEMVQQLDKWLDNLDAAKAKASAAPTTDAAWQSLLADTRPQDLTDNCVTPDGQKLASDDVYDTDNACTKAFPVHGDPRRAAAESLKNDIIKCQLVPVDASSYGVALTADQGKRLATVFPDGVCDWSKPGVGQVKLSGTWLNYGN